jgi:hypothetical protein
MIEAAPAQAVAGPVGDEPDTMSQARARCDQARRRWREMLERESVAEQLPEPARELALAGLRDDKLAAAHEFKAAMDVLLEAAVAGTNARMRRHAESYRSHAAVVEGRRREVEKAMIALVAKVWALSDAAETEFRLRSELIRLAKGGLIDTDPETADRMIAGLDLDRGRTPLSIGADGSWTSVERPNFMTRLGRGNPGMPLRVEWFERLALISRLGRNKGIFDAPEVLRNALDRAYRAATSSR